MAFEILVTSNVPLTPIKDVNEVALTFMRQIGYLPRALGVSPSGTDVKRSVPYRLFTEHLLHRMDKGKTVEQMAARLKTTKATVYRHMNKLKSLDILEEVDVETPRGQRRGYRVRYGSLAKAWNFVEAHVQVAMEHYRETVEHLQRLSEGGVT